MLEQAGRLGPSVPIITARVASGSPLASLALSAGGAGCEQPASASASVGRRRAGRCRGRRVMAPKLAAAAAAGNGLRGEDRKSVVEGKSVSRRVDLGGCCVLKKKKE